MIENKKDFSKKTFLEKNENIPTSSMYDEIYPNDQNIIFTCDIQTESSKHEYYINFHLFPLNVLFVDIYEDDLLISAFDTGENIYNHFLKSEVTINELMDYIKSDIDEAVKGDYRIVRTIGYKECKNK